MVTAITEGAVKGTKYTGRPRREGTLDRRCKEVNGMKIVKRKTVSEISGSWTCKNGVHPRPSRLLNRL